MGKDATMKEIPKNVSESVKLRNPHLYCSAEVARVLTDHKPPRRIRQSTKPLLNKLEQEWYSRQCAFFPSRTFYMQSIRFKLANGIWYKPDAVSIDFLPPTCWEIKGPHAFRGGFENLKVAAHQYPNIHWILVWKENGKWQEQEVLP